MGAGIPDNVPGLLERLAREPDSRQRQRALLSQSEALGPQTAASLYDETVRLTRVDLRQAERLAKSLAWLARHLKDESSRALGLRAMGHIHYLRGRHEPACRHYQEALEIYSAADSSRYSPIWAGTTTPSPGRNAPGTSSPGVATGSGSRGSTLTWRTS